MSRIATHDTPLGTLELWFTAGILSYRTQPRHGLAVSRGVIGQLHLDGTPVQWDAARITAVTPFNWQITLTHALLHAAIVVEWYPDHPMLRWSGTVTSQTTSPVRITGCDLLQLEIQQAPLYLFHVDQFSWAYRTDYFSRHQTQIWPARAPIEIRMGSYPSHYDGATSCAWFALRPPPHDTDERTPARGPGLVCGIEFNGKSRVYGHADATQTTIRSSIDALQHVLHPGSTFELPGVFVGQYDGDWDEAGFVTQRYAEAHVHPPYPDNRYPWVQYNSWKYGQDIDEAQQLAVIDQCHALGIEVVVLDLGWARTIGDWRPNPDKFPRGLAPIAAKAASYGMRFGVHIAIAQCAPDAPIAHEHPEWLASTYDDYYAAGTLCFGNTPCRDWIIESVSTLIREHGINYIIQDGEDMVKRCERSDHTHALGDSNYANSQQGIDVVIGTLRERFPEVVFENCEDGGMMMTYKMARLYHTSITVDNIGAYATRQGIYGASYPFSPRYSVRYFEDEPTPYNLRSSIFGGPLIFMQRISDWDAQQFADAQRAVAEYKAYRELIRSAKIIHLLAPKHNVDRIGYGWDAIQAIAPDQGTAVVFVYHARDGAASCTIYPRGCDPVRVYHIDDRDHGRIATRTGADIMTHGITVTLPELAAAILQLTAAG